MAAFDVIEDQGTRYVRITLDGQTVRADAASLRYMAGAIEMDPPRPSPGRALSNILSDEPVIRPRYTGTGEVYLTPSFGGYHTVELDGEAWILENGAYWASDGGV